MIDGRIAQEGEIVTVNMRKGEVFITTSDGQRRKARAPNIGINDIATACNHREAHLALYAFRTPEGLEGASFKVGKGGAASFHPMKSSRR